MHANSNPERVLTGEAYPPCSARPAHSFSLRSHGRRLHDRACREGVKLHPPGTVGPPVEAGAHRRLKASPSGTFGTLKPHRFLCHARTLPPTPQNVSAPCAERVPLGLANRPQGQRKGTVVRKPNVPRPLGTTCQMNRERRALRIGKLFPGIRQAGRVSLGPYRKRRVRARCRSHAVRHAFTTGPNRHK
jgi:hypothetical protein